MTLFYYFLNTPKVTILIKKKGGGPSSIIILGLSINTTTISNQTLPLTFSSLWE